MNRAERRAMQHSSERHKGKPVVRKMSRAEKGMAVFVILVAGCALLFNIVSGFCPIVTGKCLQCWWTKNPHCKYLKRGKTHQHNIPATLPTQKEGR